MDYTSSARLFQVQKVLRYTRMYGPRRTWVKVLGQLHMKRTFDELPKSSPQLHDRQTVGLLGCGNYAFSNIAFYLTRTFGDVIGACMDINANRAASLSARYRVPFHTTDAEAVIQHPSVRMVYIASTHSTHAPYAMAALKAGKHVYIEKPHVVTDEQLYDLAKTASDTNGRLYLGFNRPGSRFGRLILQYLSEQDGAGMYSWFVAGHAIDPDHWYFQPREGGRILGNLCHWTDFVLRLAGNDPFPVEIRPTRAGKSDSDIAVTYTFRDGTIAVITFSAKGHTFEGVSESFHGHRGQCLLSMHDYRELTVEIVEQKTILRNLFRDHGHAQNITSAYRSVHESLPYDRAAELNYIYDTAWLFLNTKRALEENRTIVLKPFASYPHASSRESAS